MTQGAVVRCFAGDGNSLCHLLEWIVVILTWIYTCINRIIHTKESILSYINF